MLKRDKIATSTFTANEDNAFVQFERSTANVKAEGAYEEPRCSRFPDHKTPMSNCAKDRAQLQLSVNTR